jgi:hypothetical protein
MGLDFMVAAIAWPDDRAPDWDALLAAAADLPLELADLVDEAHQLWELGAESPEDRREYASGEVTTGINELRAGLIRGDGLHITVVQPDGWTVILDGGISSGEEPTPTRYSLEALAVTGLAGEPLIRYSDAPPPTALPRGDRPLIDALVPISRPPRLIVVAFPDAVDWDRARSVTPDDGGPLLERLREVVDGGYSRRTKALRCGDTTLLLGDRADPTGVASAISTWQSWGLLDAIGAQVLADVRLTQSPSGELP